jgi:hypothetical protein
LQNKELRQKNSLQDHGSKITRGCIFDRKHRRTSVSNPSLCFDCQQKLSLLENSIREAWEARKLPLVDDIKTIVSREWMGNPEKRDSAFYNLKKMFKYDVDRNSGFYKKWYEKFRDTIVDKSAEWTVGPIIGGFIAGMITVFFILVFKIKP